jgi:hypothetical protein
MASTTLLPGGQNGVRIWNRELTAYPERGARRMYLLLVVLITVTLYYELYVGSGVATIMLAQLKIPFPIFVYILAAGNLLGAFASLLAGLADRFGRANLVVYGLLVVGLITLFWVPNVTTARGFALSFGVVSLSTVVASERAGLVERNISGTSRRTAMSVRPGRSRFSPHRVLGLRPRLVRALCMLVTPIMSPNAVSLLTLVSSPLSSSWPKNMDSKNATSGVDHTRIDAPFQAIPLCHRTRVGVQGGGGRSSRIKTSASSTTFPILRALGNPISPR